MGLIAQLVRYVVMAGIQIGAFSAAQAFLEKALDGIATFFVSTEGVTNAEAEDSIAAEIVAFAGALGANAFLIRSRLPVRWADKVSKSIRAPKVTSTGTLKGAPATAAAVEKFRNFGFVGKTMSTLGLSFVASLPWLPSLLQNFLDQGTFNPTNANRALQAVGLGGVFQWPTAPKELQPGTYTAGEFLELFEQLSAAGAVGINNTFEQQSQVWDKGNLSQLINTIVGDLVIRGKKSDKTAIRAELSKYIISRGGGSLPATFSPSTYSPTQSVFSTNAPTQIQIYTGVISNGALGTASEFVARPDDMINSVDELKAAAKNNLASFVQALPGKFYYELAIVNSIKTRGGFTQKGESVKVISGYNKDGKPRYKTVYHKFAVLQLGVLDETGRSVKLAKIVLGPVDAVGFQPTGAQLQDVAKLITPELFTSDIGQVNTIITPAPVVVTPTQPTNPNPPAYSPAPTPSPAGGTAYQAPAPVAPAPVVSAPVNPPPVATPVQAPPPPKPSLTPQQQAIKNATTLFDAYSAIGGLPSISQRANIYASWGLGAASTYTGTAEQNNRYLAELKRQFGVG